jgi:hypothetical protein
MPLIAVWTFNDAGAATDTITSDGSTQSGTYEAGASAAAGSVSFDGIDDHVLIGSDSSFQLPQGTITMQFTPTTLQYGWVFSRDSSGNDDGGHFSVFTNGDGSVGIRHQTDTGSPTFLTPAGFYQAGDQLNVTYSWASDGSGGEFRVENLTQGTTHTQTISTPLTWEQGAYNEPITIGASQGGSGNNQADILRDYFEGEVEFVALYDTVEPAAGVVCFGAETLIRTPSGAVRAGDIAVGDLVVTKQNGAQRVNWVGRRRISPLDLMLKPRLRPVRITAGALGQGLPERDLLVSRQRRILVASRVAQRMFGAAEVLVAAIKLTRLPGVYLDDTVSGIEYVHFMCAAHQVVFAEGAPAESLFFGAEAVHSLPDGALAELLAVFPQGAPRFGAMPKAAFVPSGRQQRQLVARHLKTGRPMHDIA